MVKKNMNPDADAEVFSFADMYGAIENREGHVSKASDDTAVQKIGVAGKNRNDTKEINIIKWSDNALCIDVRRWRNGKPLKGIAFYPDEIDELIKLLKKAKKEVI